jgi:hypothetical protein
MQITQIYLLNQRQNIILNDVGYITEHRPVYEKNLQVYKGIDNALQFRLYNADQKAVDISDLTPYFVAYDENKSIVIEKIGTILQTNDSTVFRNKGLFSVNLSEYDLQNLDNQYITYSIYFKNTENQNVLTYTNSHFGGVNYIKLNDAIYPDPLISKSATVFTPNLDLGDPITEWISESIYADPEKNNNDALNTVVVYTNSYTGNVVVQGTLENQITEFTNWVDLETIEFAGDETTPVYKNFNGVFTYFRFTTNADPKNTIEKILIRN